MSNTFIFRPLVASEASRWSIISSFEARSPFVYSTRIPARSLNPQTDKKLSESQWVSLGERYCTGGGDSEARVGQGAARCPPCSQNARPRKALVRCAQSRATLATPFNTRKEE